MFKIPFTSYFTKSVKSYLVCEGEGIVKHLTHLEELILTRKEEGLDTAVKFINELYKVFRGHGKSEIATTIKYDGAPAIIFGYNPENSKFFIGTKSVGNVGTPKVNYTNEDIDRNHGDKPGLADKLKLCLEYLPEVIRSGIYQGDFMFDSDSIKDLVLDNKHYYTFKPQAITYAIDANSPEGVKVKRAKVGIVIHTRYIGPTLSELVQKFGVSVAEFPKSQDVWLEDALFKDVTGTVTLTEQESGNIQKALSSITTAGKATKWNNIPNDIYKLLNMYINVLI
jgi:hypothetical protein